jgi:hypothetical protein
MIVDNKLSHNLSSNVEGFKMKIIQKGEENPCFTDKIIKTIFRFEHVSPHTMLNSS